MPSDTGVKADDSMATDKRYLIHCFSPINVISALAAIEHLAPGEKDIADLLIYQPGLPDMVQEEIAKFARRACRASASIRNVVCTTERVWRSMADRPTDQKATALSEMLDLNGVDAILYAHDVVGDVLDTFVDIIPGLERICYGDAMGQVYERDVHLSYILPRDAAKKSWKSFFESLLWRPRLPDPVRTRALPDKAILMLPVDQSGQILRNVSFAVISQKVAQSLFQRVAAQFPELGAYLREEMSGGDGQSGLILLTENWSEGGFIPFDREIDFYADIIRAHAEKGAVVWIKPHPGEVSDRHAALAERLAGHCTVRPVRNEFRRIPFEIWAQHLDGIRIIAMQYPALSLRYLLGRDVIQPLDHAKIDRYFPARICASYKNALDLNMIPLQRLSAWDGKSPLYCGG